MKLFLSIVVFVFSSAICKGQTQSMMFEKRWGLDWQSFSNTILYVDQLSNGDYLMVGSTTINFPSGFQHYACRTDSTGEILWEKAWGLEDPRCGFSKAIKCSNGTYLAVGSGVSGMGGGVSDITVTNIDSDGNLIFCKYYDFSYEDRGFDIMPTFDGGYIIGGVKGTASGSYHPAFVKIDGAGNEIWRRTQSSFSNYSPFQLSRTADSGFVVLGQTTSFNNCYYAKYDSLGMMEWIRYPFGLGDSSDNYPGDIRANANGTIDIMYRTNYTVGFPPTNVSALFIHYTGQGDTLWSKQYYDGMASFFVRDEDSAFCCMKGGNGLAVMNADYEFEMKTHLGGAGRYLYNYFRTNDGGYIGCGRTSDGNAGDKFYVVKFAPDGRYSADSFLSLINISPNPSADGNITVGFDVQTDENVHVRVLAMNGRLVYYDEFFCPEGSHTELPIHLDAATATAGMYILEVKTSGEYRRERIIVTRKAE